MNIDEKIKSHEKYVQTLGEQGKKLILDEFVFKNKELSDVDLSESFLTACSFDNLFLKRVDFYGVELYSSSFRNTQIIQGDYVKSKLGYASFASANICVTNFLKAELYETDFSSALIKNSNLASANLREADFSHSVLEDVDFEFTWFEETVLKGLMLKNPINLNGAYINSINIGTVKNPIILKKDQAIQWIFSRASE